jgi:hypothetical protein
MISDQDFDRLLAELKRWQAERRQADEIFRENRNNFQTFSAGPGSVGVPAPQAISVGVGRDFSGIDRLYETTQERERRKLAGT